MLLKKNQDKTKAAAEEKARLDELAAK